MSSIGLWQIADGAPTRLPASAVDLEAHLEDWIERDPALVQPGLVIVGRQWITPAGRLDLVALDAQGRWVVIEIKRGIVRRETVVQALDYGAWIASAAADELEQRADAYLRARGAGDDLRSLLHTRSAQQDGDEEAERDVDILVVGTGRDAGLERLVSFLAGRDIEIGVVLFDVFATGSGVQILTRVLTEADTQQTPATRRRSQLEVDDILRQADQLGQGPVFRQVHRAAVELGLSPRGYKRSIMYAPASNRRRCLFVASTDGARAPDVEMYVVPAAFNEFYGIDEERARRELGEGWTVLTAETAPGFVERLGGLFESGD